MKDRKIYMGKATKFYVYIFIYIYLRLIIYPNYTGYHIDDVITVFSFTVGFYVLRIFHSKAVLPGYLTFVIYNLLLLISPIYNAVIYIDYNKHFSKPMMESPPVS